MEIAFGQPVTQQHLALSDASTCISFILNEIVGGGNSIYLISDSSFDFSWQIYDC